MINKYMKKVLVGIAIAVASILLLGGIIALFADPYEEGIKAMERKDYENAQYWMQKVPEKHPKYKAAVNLLDEQSGEIGVALVYAGKAQMEKERADDEAKNAKRAETKFKDSVTRAQYSCKTAAVKAAKWDGAESDFLPNSEVTKNNDDTLVVRGRDVKFANGFGAKGYIVYTGIYSLKTDNCTIINING